MMSATDLFNDESVAFGVLWLAFLLELLSIVVVILIFTSQIKAKSRRTFKTIRLAIRTLRNA
jgi:hypothetical protein